MPVLTTIAKTERPKIVAPLKAGIVTATPIIEDPTEKQMQEETKKLIEAIDTETQQNPDEDDAKAIRAKLEAKKNRTPAEKRKELPSVKKRAGRKCLWKKNPKPCERCKEIFKPWDPRTKYCVPCGKIIAAESGREKWGMPPLQQSDIEERIRPFLRLGLNLREACLEAEVSYSTVLEKKKTWNWFAEFIERHENFVIVKAKRAIFEATGDKLHKDQNSTAKWLLERRRSEEYGTKVEVKGNLNYTEELSPEKKLLLKQLLERTGKKQRKDI